MIRLWLLQRRLRITLRQRRRYPARSRSNAPARAPWLTMSRSRLWTSNTGRMATKMRWLLILLLTSTAFAQIIPTDLPLGPIGNNGDVTTQSENRDFIRVGRLEATTLTQLTMITTTTINRQYIQMLDDATTQTTTTNRIIFIRVRVPGAFVRRIKSDLYHFNIFTGGFYRPMTRVERLARGLP